MTLCSSASGLPRDPGTILRGAANPEGGPLPPEARRLPKSVFAYDQITDLSILPILVLPVSIIAI